MTDISVTAASVIAGADAAIDRSITFGATVVAGKVLYEDPTTGKYGLADHDDATAAVRVAAGIALCGGGDGQPGAMLKSGDLTLNAVLTKGVTYCLSGTAGGICPQADVTTGDDLVILGVALSTTVLRVRIQNIGITL